MRWKIAGVDAESGRRWEVTILARDAEDAAAQAKFYRQTPVPVGEGDAGTELKGMDAPSKALLATLLVPLVLVALAVKSVLLAASTLRRLIVS